MKKCPNCGELIGDNVSECFNCHYNYIYKRIITQQERKIERDKKNELIKKEPDYGIIIEDDKVVHAVNSKEGYMTLKARSIILAMRCYE